MATICLSMVKMEHNTQLLIIQSSTVHSIGYNFSSSLEVVKSTTSLPVSLEPTGDTMMTKWLPQASSFLAGIQHHVAVHFYHPGQTFTIASLTAVNQKATAMALGSGTDFSASVGT